MKLNHFSITDTTLIFLGSLFFFTFGLQHAEIIGFESRFYVFSLEMYRHGVTWFPTTYKTPYPDYLGTSTFLIYLAAKGLGGLNKLTAVLPSAIAGSITLVATYLIGALQKRALGLYAAGFLLFTLAFLSAARTISLDIFVTAFTTLIFYIAYRAKLQQQKIPLILILLLLTASFSIRGPLGIVIPAGVLSLFYLLYQNIKYFFVIAISFLLLLLI